MKMMFLSYLKYRFKKSFLFQASFWESIGFFIVLLIVLFGPPFIIGEKWLNFVGLLILFGIAWGLFSYIIEKIKSFFTKYKQYKDWRKRNEEGNK